MLHLIVNPVAGRGRGPHALAAMRRLLDDAGRTYRVYTTRAPKHATALAAALPADATVVAVGGDGTAHEVARACIGTERTLGILPVGSGDDYAFALGLDRGDLEGAFRRLLDGRPRWVDTGTVNGEPFVNAAGVGFDADVARRVATAPAPLSGLGTYLYAVARALGGLRCVDLLAEVDGRTVYRGPSLLVSTQLGPRTGGSFLFAPEARVDDGLFDVLVAGRLGRVGTLRLLPKAMRGAHLGDPAVHYARGTEVRLAWDRPQHAHTEGEAIGQASTYTLRLVPRSLRVLG